MSCSLPRGGRCATLQVPLDWSAPEGPTIDLALGRIEATGSRIGSLITNPGGPGGSGVEFLGYDTFATPVRERFDLVSWDPRGVGASTAVTCGGSTDALVQSDPDPDTLDEQMALDNAAAAIVSDCATTAGDLLDHLGTADVARDLEAIRLALGDEPLNYIGFSYGTSIGQQYADRFADNIRTMVLDVVIDPALGFTEFLLGQAAAFETAFERNDAECAAAGIERCGVASLAQAYDQMEAVIETAPLTGGGAAVGPAVLATAAIQTSYGRDGWRRLGPALAAAQRGDGGSLWRLAASYYDFGGYTSYAAVVCTDSPPPSGAAAYQAFAQQAHDVAPRFGGSVANEMLPCATWPAAPVDEPAAVTAPGSPPILVVGNTGDAATPYENAVTVAGALESGVLVTVEVDGHTAYSSNRCATQVIDAYLVDLRVPDTDPRCS